ncbi:HDA18 [Symbiodinium natans]|uniref:HDA18 protein n=1 Tax=Symbiodinium natans TaxID=878477 RepID=A0A812UAY1_9DINO|nr:HDA18 [Symbiodinium natans]
MRCGNFHASKDGGATWIVQLPTAGVRFLPEAETLLEKSGLPKLTDFYRALVDAYPGFHVPLAKLLTQNLRAAGVSGLTSSSSDSDSEEKKKKKKKKKKLKKEAKKAEKRKKEMAAGDKEKEEEEEEEEGTKAKKAKGLAEAVDVKTCTAQEVDDELLKELEFEKRRTRPQK